MAIEAGVLSAYYRFLLLKRPFRDLEPKIGTRQAETAEEFIDSKHIGNVAAVVRKVCGHTPWESKCLVQALTAKKMLNRRKLPCTLYMGVANDGNGQMIAHAWLRCGGVYVTGGRNRERFTVTGIYGDRVL